MPFSRRLTGLTVLVTRPKAQAQDLASRLRKAGCRIVLAPLVKTVRPSSFAGLDKAILRLGAYHAAVFTSSRGVSAFFDRARRLGLKVPTRPGKVFAVGKSTASALAAAGWDGAAVPRVENTEGLARVMKGLSGKRVLFPRAREGRDALPRLLRRAGARVTLVEAYRTVPDPAGRRTLLAAVGRGVDAAVFASPSAARAFHRTLGPSGVKRFLERGGAVSIGPTTTTGLKALGIGPVIEASGTGTGPLLDAVVRCLARKGRP